MLRSLALARSACSRHSRRMGEFSISKMDFLVRARRGCAPLSKSFVSSQPTSDGVDASSDSIFTAHSYCTSQPPLSLPISQTRSTPPTPPDTDDSVDDHDVSDIKRVPANTESS